MPKRSMQNSAYENQNVEWKVSWRDEHLKCLSAFANTEGGVLEIGRDDSGNVVGVSELLKLLEMLPNKIRELLGIVAKIEVRKEAGKEYLAIVVDPFPYPVSFRGQYYIRAGSTSQELKNAALDHFLLRKQGKRWDGIPLPKTTFSDLDKQALRQFRERAAKSQRVSQELLKENDSHLIEKLHLSENSLLKRAAVLLFHADPEQYVVGAFVKVGFFKSDADLLFQDEIHGNLFKQVIDTTELLQTKYLKASISYKGVQRLESLAVPEAALREAVLNAITHKDYSSGIPVQISVYEDKLMIWNAGTLPS